MTAAVLMLSAVAHHAMAAGMTPESGMAMQSQANDTQTSDMAAHQTDAPCPMSSDCSNDTDMRAMACFAHCATVLGVLAESGRIAVMALAHALDIPLARPLVSLNGPPDAPPPKTLILI